MLGRFFLITFLALSLLLAAGGSKAFAIVTPNFPSCENPQGSLVVSYDSGTHGVVGNSSNFTGKDSVYNVTDNTLIQCLCTNQGQGIQTNWWKVSSLDEIQLQTLKNMGWFYIPDGSLWGLASAPYMAINSSYTCVSGQGGGGSNSGTGGGEVLGAATQAVLGLATTGDSLLLYSIFGLGILALFAGLVVRFKK